MNTPFVTIPKISLVWSGLLALAACGGSNHSTTSQSPGIKVSVSTPTSTALLGTTQQFTATVAGSSNTAVTWSVNGIVGGNSTTGTITSAGLYTAPADLPNPATITVTATSQADASKSASVSQTISSDIAVKLSTALVGVDSVATNGTLALVVAVASAGHPNPAIRWSVNGVVNGDATVGTVTQNNINTASYFAPARVPTPYTVTIIATSAADPTKTSGVSLVVSGVISSTSQNITAAQGGAVSLPDGSSVTIPAGALSSDQMVTVSLVSQLPHGPPDAGVTGVGPALLLALGVPNSALARRSSSSSHRGRVAAVPSASSSVDVQFSINTSANSVSGLQGSTPIGDLTDTSGTSTFIATTGSLDSATHLATIAVPSSLLPNVRSIAVSMANWATGPALQTAERSFDGANWTPFACPQGPKVDVLVHGMLSSVEKAFSCAGDIQTAGQYNGVVGFNYDWTRDITNSGAMLAAFLDKVAACKGVSQVDIEAHSEGVAVSMSAAGLVIPTTQQKIKNFVSLGGPIMGTPIAADPNRLELVSGLLNLPGTSYVRGATFQDFLTGPVPSELSPNSQTLATIRSGFPPAIRVLTVAGAKPDFDPLLLSVIAPLFPGVPFDDLIGVDSALGKNSGLSNLSQLRVYGLSHTQLECDSNVIHDVGVALQGSAPAPTIAVNPTSLSFSALEGGTTNPVSQAFVIQNVGPAASTLNYAVGQDATWLGLGGPIAPLISGDSATWTVTVNTTGLAAGTYSGTITVSDTAASNKSVSVAVALTITPQGTSSVTLTVATAGLGTGSVVSLPAGIDCVTTCSATFPSGTPVTLTAMPDAVSTFTGWSGACSGTGSCTVVLNGNTTVTATFGPPPRYLGTATEAYSQTGPNLGCTPDPLTMIGTTPAFNIEFDSTADLLLPGPIVISIYVGASTQTMQVPGQTCGGVALPPFTFTNSYTGGFFGSIHAVSDGKTVTSNDISSLLGAGCTGTSATTITVDAATGVVQLTGQLNANCDSGGGLTSTDSYQFSLTQQ